MDVYANENAIACKAGDGKVIASFPDVCLSPPSPPAGPLPVPYPDTSFSRDMKSGSKTVKIENKEVMLKDSSYYKSSPLGDEAATRSFGANILSHSITGKTYFVAWSMDVKFDGENVDRHTDFTTSNHASYPAGVAVPNPDMEKLALQRIDQGKCPCCRKELHSVEPTSDTAAAGGPTKWYTSKSDAMGMEEWYTKMIDNAAGKTAAEKTALKAQFQNTLARAKAKPRAGCTCRSKEQRVLPEPPCDVFWYKPSTAAKTNIKDSWDNKRNNTNYQLNNGIPDLPHVQANWGGRVTAKFVAKHGRTPTTAEFNNAIRKERSVMHKTPKTAGGCPTGDKNLQPYQQLCAACQKLDDEFGKIQELNQI